MARHSPKTRETTERSSSPPSSSSISSSPLGSRSINSIRNNPISSLSRGSSPSRESKSFNNRSPCSNNKSRKGRNRNRQSLQRQKSLRRTTNRIDYRAFLPGGSRAKRHAPRPFHSRLLNCAPM